MALVVTRKKGEGVQVGDAHVSVHSIQGGRVRLRVAAPADTLILRDELSPYELDEVPFELPEEKRGTTTEEAKRNGAPF